MSSVRIIDLVLGAILGIVLYATYNRIREKLASFGRHTVIIYKDGQEQKRYHASAGRNGEDLQHYLEEQLKKFVNLKLISLGPVFEAETFPNGTTKVWQKTNGMLKDSLIMIEYLPA